MLANHHPHQLIVGGRTHVLDEYELVGVRYVPVYAQSKQVEVDPAPVEGQNLVLIYDLLRDILRIQVDLNIETIEPNNVGFGNN